MHIERPNVSSERTTYRTASRAMLAFFLLAASSSAQASLNESVLYSFQGGSDGAVPMDLLSGPGGVFYGATEYGGDARYCQPNGCGTVFQVSPPSRPGGQWTKTTLVEFNGSNGKTPFGGLVSDSSGNLYGATFYGGAFGLGVVFEVSPPSLPGGFWTEAVLHDFAGSASDGALPVGRLLIDSQGNLFGTTELGGTNCGDGCGTVFELTPPAQHGDAWSESIVFDFGSTYGFDGIWPNGGLIQTASGVSNPAEPPGALYGTTYLGGSFDNGGVVFQLLPPSLPGGAWTPNALHVFKAVGSHPGDGFSPLAGLYMDGTGNLFGTTQQGGIIQDGLTRGTVYEVSPPSQPGGRWFEKVIYAFTNQAGDGYYAASYLIPDQSGALYSTTSNGGRQDLCLGGCGIAFKLNNVGGRWVETILYDFLGSEGGAFPGGLLLGPTGTLYGPAAGGLHGGGVIFQLK